MPDTSQLTEPELTSDVSCSTRVSMPASVDVPPLHEMFLPGILVSAVPEESSTGFVAPLERFSADHPQLDIGSSFVQSDNVILHIINRANHPITISKNTHVATFTPASVEPDSTLSCTCNMLGEEGVPPVKPPQIVAPSYHATCKPHAVICHRPSCTHLRLSCMNAMMFLP